jgi:glucose/arabinose dehydrogenase
MPRSSLDGRFGLAAALVLSLGLAGCGDTAHLTVAQGTGPRPVLPPPAKTLIPTVKVADAVGWPAGAAPLAAPGLRAVAFANGLDHPRSLYVLPNGDVLVAETNAPPKPDDGTGIKGFFFKMFQKKAGAAVPSANRITLLRDADGDGMAETKTPFITGLNSPFGMTLLGGTLYVADSDGLLAFPYAPGATRIAAPGRVVSRLPAGRINHHWTKSLVASPDGRRLYVGVGSNSNVMENGVAVEQGRASVWEIDPMSGASQVFAGGLRNPVGLAIEPSSGALWAAVNERDELGSDLVPDYMTSVRRGGFYGWPYSYYGGHIDNRAKPPRPDLVARAIIPDYALGPHTGSLGLTFARGPALGLNFANGAFIGQHGSWNRNPRSGYKVIFVPFAGGRPAGMPRDVLTGFLDAKGRAMGRPVGVAIDRSGALLVADDVGNTVWRVTARGAA